MKKYMIAFGFILAASVVLNVVLYNKNARNEFLLQLETKRGQINEDMLTEVTYSLKDKDNNAQIARMEGYMEAINTCALNLPPKDHYVGQIWHGGYYNGQQQQEFYAEVKYEQGFNQGFQKGQNENMKAIQTILKSGNNIQSAIEGFIQSQNKQEEKPQNIEKPESNKSQK